MFGHICCKNNWHNEFDDELPSVSHFSLATTMRGIPFGEGGL